jgi:hypothetical protein
MPALKSNSAYARLKNFENKLEANAENLHNLYANNPGSVRFTSRNIKARLAKLRHNFNAAVAEDLARGMGTLHSNLKNYEKQYINLEKKIKQEKLNVNKANKVHFGQPGSYYGYKNYNAYVAMERKKKALNAKHNQLLGNALKRFRYIKAAIEKRKLSETQARAAIRKHLFSPGAPFNRLLHDPNKGMRTATMLNTRGSVSYKRHFDKIRNLERQIMHLKAKK